MKAAIDNVNNIYIWDDGKIYTVDWLCYTNSEDVTEVKRSELVPYNDDIPCKLRQVAIRIID